jgi:hypothetical protein
MDKPMIVTVSENFVDMKQIKELCDKNGWKLVVLKKEPQEV